MDPFCLIDRGLISRMPTFQSLAAKILVLCHLLHKTTHTYMLTLPDWRKVKSDFFFVIVQIPCTLHL